MNNECILREAARQRARLLAADGSPARLKPVSSQDPDCQRAEQLAERVLSGVDKLASDSGSPLHDKLKALADEAFAAYPDAALSKQRAPRRWRLPAALAASVAIGLIVLRLAPTIAPSDVQPVVHETSNERRSVTLEDGSSIELDVGTRIAVRMSEERREIELLSGRALFDVAHDVARPFSVTAGNARTTALGTRFQVQRQDQRVVVMLAEGSVAIDDIAASRGEQWSERLVPGEQLSIDGAAHSRVRHFADAQIVTSWTQGRHVFRGTPLEQALAEVNRYAAKKVRLGDPSLASLPVGGNFVAGDSEVVIAAFAAVLPLRVVDGGDSEIILFRRYGN